ncbi:member of Set1p complex, histone methyl transferase [Ascosphaera aggregata]|nr:member of Set1p complex, histone methyl transferase [Ascosphaera aggregata]
MVESSASTLPTHPLGPTAKVSDVLSTYRPTKVFRLSATTSSSSATSSRPPKASSSASSSSSSSSSHITALDFDDQGDFLVSSSTDESLQIYNVKEGHISQTILSKKYGCHLPRFTHSSTQLLYASTKVDDALRLLDLQSEQYLRYFSGHKGKVTNVTLSPGSDGFLTCGRDDMVMLWDLSSRNAQGKLRVSTPYLAAFDPSGYVFAIASQSTASILLYDFRNFDKPPFAIFDIAPFEDRYFNSNTKSRGRSAWNKIDFSNDGKFILVPNDWGGHYLLDAFDGTLKAFLSGKSGHTGRRLAPSTSPVASARGDVPVGQGDTTFSPDGRYVIGGSGGHAPDDPAELLVWDLTGQVDANLVLKPAFRLPATAALTSGGSAGAGSAIRVGRPVVTVMNPRYNMLATADKEVVFWVPEEVGASAGSANSAAGSGNAGGSTPATAGGQ